MIVVLQYCIFIVVVTMLSPESAADETRSQPPPLPHQSLQADGKAVDVVQIV